jgi:hypothetical protein
LKIETYNLPFLRQDSQDLLDICFLAFRTKAKQCNRLRRI